MCTKYNSTWMLINSIKNKQYIFLEFLYKAISNHKLRNLKHQILCKHNYTSLMQMNI